jgi:hypothetical protein
MLNVAGRSRRFSPEGKSYKKLWEGRGVENWVFRILQAEDNEMHYTCANSFHSV